MRKNHTSNNDLSFDSKVKTLRRAANYIGYLQSLMAHGNDSGEKQYNNGSWKLPSPRWRTIIGSVNGHHKDEQLYSAGQNM